MKIAKSAVWLLTTPNVYDSIRNEANTLVFYSFFKTLVDQEVTVELKNDLAIKGILKSVDQFLNIKLDDITVLEENKYPHLVKALFPTALTSPGCSKECLHSRVGGEVCPSSCIGSGYGVTGGCYTKRFIPAIVHDLIM